MAKYTMELSQILRGLRKPPCSPYEFVAPLDLIYDTYEEFFKYVPIPTFPDYDYGGIDPVEFEKCFKIEFLKYFYTYEIGYNTPDRFFLAASSYLARRLPIYFEHWRHIPAEMYLTNINWGTQFGSQISDGIQENQANATDNRQNDGYSENQSNAATSQQNDSHSLNHTDGTTNGSSEGKTLNQSMQLQGISDTPQNELDLNVENIDYASQVSKSNSIAEGDTESRQHGTSESDGEAKEHTEGSGNTHQDGSAHEHSDSVGNSHQEGEAHDHRETRNTGNNQTKGRNRDVFEILKLVFLKSCELIYY